MSLRGDVKRSYWPPLRVSEQGRALHDAIMAQLNANANGSQYQRLRLVLWCAETLRERGLPDSSADILAWGGDKWRYATDEDRKRVMDGEPGAIIRPERYCEVRFGMLSEEWRYARFVRLGEQVLLKGEEFAAMELGEELYQYFTVQRIYMPTMELGGRMKEGRQKPKRGLLACLIDDALAALGERAPVKGILHWIQANHDGEVIQEIEEDPKGPIIYWRARNGREMKTTFKRFQSLVSERRSERRKNLI